MSGGLIARFRIEQSDNDALSSDYIVALPVVYTTREVTLRVRPLHRSGHVGDELITKSGIRRMEYDHEEIDALVALRWRGLRPYAGGTLTLASSYPEDTGGLRAGFDLERQLRPALSLQGGFDWQRVALTQWADRFSGAIGLQLLRQGRGAGLLLRYATGASAVGEFFPDRESYWGLEIVLRPGL